MRELSIREQSWSLDDEEHLVGDAERLESDDPVKAATIQYSYAKI
ncbi:hypothetical protein [Actinomadura fibrosa]|uniref:Uncharacterized protein n=1 Tax=Actinomadura fibrosa TaxID=111802 RepID=A0ABW2XNM6_9ACTN|nr:hypothetical protein [Actinomadura fibrosa]